MSSTRETDLLLKIFRSGLLINFDDLESLSHRMVREALSKDLKMNYKKMYKIESKASNPKKYFRPQPPSDTTQRLWDSEIELIYFEEFMLSGRCLNYKGLGNWGNKCHLIYTDDNFSISIIISFSFKRIYGLLDTSDTTY